MLKRALLPVALAGLLNACGNDPAPVIITSTCSIDVPATDSIVERGKPLHVGGWAFDKVSGNSPEKVRLQLLAEDQRTSITVNAIRGTKRPDVVKAYDAPGAEASGFDANVDTSALVPGKYAVYVIQESKGAMLLCPKENAFSVK